MKNVILPPVAKKRAVSVAMLGAAVPGPVQGLFAQMAGSPNFMEIACAENSSLTSQMESLGYACKRINYKQGYDLGRPLGARMLATELKMHPPRFEWVSWPCTRLSPLQNLTERSLEESANFEKQCGADLKRADEVAQGIEQALDSQMDFDFGWEWPANASSGWRSKGIHRILKKMAQLQRPVFWCRFHGCAYGLRYKNVPVLKGWTVMTSSRKVWLSLQRKCPGHEHHAECRGIAAQASA